MQALGYTYGSGIMSVLVNVEFNVNLPPSSDALVKSGSDLDVRP